MAITSILLSSTALPIYIASTVLFWIVGLVVYRRFFHPLASIPGPFFAAVTDLYVLKFNLLSQRSQFYLQIEKLHDQYGPVVRIKPNEVHLNDPENYDKIYCMGTPFSKEADFYGAFSLGTAIFGIASNELHRIRRAPLNPFFSRKRVLELEHVVQSKTQTLCSRVEAAVTAKQPADLFHAYRALFIDVISDYAFDRCFGPMRWLFGFLPLLDSATRMLPLWSVKYLSKSLAQCMEFQYNVIGEIKQIQDNIATRKQRISSDKTIFYDLMDPNAMQGHAVLSAEAISDEALLLVLAASETVGNALSLSTYHVLANDSIRSTLIEELKEAFPDPSATMSFLALEKLPYLTAVIKETLRLSYGVPGRLPRVTPPSGAVFNGYTIPGGSVVGMSAWCMHRNPRAFPDPDTFDPDRWRQPEKSRKREQYLVPFSKGPRVCLGMQLAYCELYVALGTFFRRIENVKVHKTGPEDLVFDDYFAPYFPPDSNKLAVVAVE